MRRRLALAAFVAEVVVEHGVRSRHGGTPSPRWGEGGSEGEPNCRCRNPLTPPLSPAGRGSRPHSWLRRASHHALMGAACVILSLTAATAEPVEDFYRGKTITIYVGTGIGAGAVSAYPMALAPVIKKYIPGK